MESLSLSKGGLFTLVVGVVIALFVVKYLNSKLITSIG
jgi:hypothetical protein